LKLKQPTKRLSVPFVNDLEAEVIALFVRLSRAFGQRVIEIAITGSANLADAEASLRRTLPHLIRVRSPNP
jgi:hypothetical protein